MPGMLQEALRAALGGIEARRADRLLPLGIPGVDTGIGLAPPGTVTVLADPDRCGGLDIAAAAMRGLALGGGAACGVCLADLPPSAIALRLLAQEAGIALRRIETGRLQDPELQRVMQAAAACWEAPVEFDSPDRFDLRPPRGIVVAALLQRFGAGSLALLEDAGRRLNVPVLAVSFRSRRWILRHLGEPHRVLEVASLGTGRRALEAPGISCSVRLR